MPLSVLRYYLFFILWPSCSFSYINVDEKKREFIILNIGVAQGGDRSQKEEEGCELGVQTTNEYDMEELT